MRRFRVNNLTVAVDDAAELLQNCGLNFSCPAISCPTGSIDCLNLTNPLGCGAVPISRLTCNFSGGCRFAFSPVPTDDGCGRNFSTLDLKNLSELVRLRDPVDRVSLISEMRADLKVALEQLDLAEIEATQLSQPRTLDEAESLEANLESALTEVRAMKKKLGQ